jgi:hypothetical protein
MTLYVVRGEYRERDWEKKDEEGRRNDGGRNGKKNGEEISGNGERTGEGARK